MTVNARPREVVAIQQLRGIAAMLVVLHHACGALPWLSNPLAGTHFGEAGVDIFFVISGFIMVVAARGERPGEFFAKRLLRIVPLYWLATALFIAMRISHLGEPDMTLVGIAKSLLFIPYRADPAIWYTAPVLIPGWSLNVEMLFYLIFGIGLSLGRPILFSAITVTLLAVTGIVFQPYQEIALTYTRPILLEFVAGMGLALLYLTGRLPRQLAPLLLLGTLSILFSDVGGEPWNRIARGLGGLMVVTGSLALEPTFQRLQGLRWVGDASYAIYLFHSMVLMLVRKVFERLPLHGFDQFLLFIIVSLGASAVAGFVIHIWVERPLTRLLRRILFPASRTRLQPPAILESPASTENGALSGGLIGVGREEQTA